jgi:hypothetical protein
VILICIHTKCPAMPPMDGLRKILESYANHNISIHAKKLKRTEKFSNGGWASMQKNVNNHRTNNMHTNKLKLIHEI